ncbi:hypothetical protein AB0D04_13840 [Streptomyces sp. NPDC048483]|uniref:hypothetical protein n=1 Tax=Streptomyces sp. NPDC048483 TaxID=3154927 RepID=UPI003448BBF5
MSNGTARLTYKIFGRSESTVRDFWRTYALRGSAPETSEHSYTDHKQGHRREITVTYDPPADASGADREHPADETPATIIVTARPA